MVTKWYQSRKTFTYGTHDLEPGEIVELIPDARNNAALERLEYIVPFGGFEGDMFKCDCGCGKSFAKEDFIIGHLRHAKGEVESARRRKISHDNKEASWKHAQKEQKAREDKNRLEMEKANKEYAAEAKKHEAKKRLYQ